MKRMMGELREQLEKFGGKSKQSTNHKFMEEVCYKENLELGIRTRASGGTLSSETVGDSEGKVLEGLEGEVRQEVIGVNSGGSSRSSSEPLDQSANVESLMSGDDVGDSMMMTKEGKQLEMTIGESSETIRAVRRGLSREGVL